MMKIDQSAGIFLIRPDFYTALTEKCHYQQVARLPGAV